MSTPESLAAAFARGMMEAMLSQPEKKAKSEKPTVVAQDAVNAAVANYLRPFVEQEPPSAPQLDLFTGRLEDEGATDLEEMTLRRIAEARARREAREGGDLPPGTYDPNLPHGSPWVSPEPG